MEKDTDEIMMAFERPVTLYDWINSDRNILESSLPIKIAGSAQQFAWSKRHHDVYPIDEDCLRLRNMVILSCLDVDAVISHVTEVKFGKSYNEQAFTSWFADLELSTDKNLDQDLRRAVFQMFTLLQPFQQVVKTIKGICCAMFTEYMVNRERALWFNGSSDPAFTGERVVILHACK